MISHGVHIKLIEAGFYGEEAKLAENLCIHEECCGASMGDLIEALDTRFECLYRRVNLKSDLSTKEWMAYGFNCAQGGVGPTPEDALGNLWLIIHEPLTVEK